MMSDSIANFMRRAAGAVATAAALGWALMPGARDNTKKTGLKIVADKTYPPTTTDYTPIVRAVRATNPDIVHVASMDARRPAARP